MNSRSFLAAIFLVTTVLIAPLLATLPNAAIPDNLGVNIHFTTPRPGELDELAAAGFSFIRMDFSWVAIEKQKSQYDFAAYDHLLASLDKHHLRAVLILDYNNRLYDNDQSPHTDESRSAFANFAAAAVTHFKNRGVLWEMWNEPNGKQFWHPKENVDDYARLAVTVGKAIKSAAPAETFVGPATSGVDLHFIESCFKAGCLQYWDAVSVHPYRNGSPESAAADYRKLRDLIAKYAPGKSIPILSSEWGYSTHAKGGVTEERQADYLARQWLTNLSNDIRLSIWYDWHDDGPDPNENEHHFGIVHYNYNKSAAPLYNPKPAYLAAQKFTTELRGYTFDKSIPLEHPEDHCLLFARGKELKLAFWTQSKEPHKIAVQDYGVEIDLTSTPAYIAAPR